MTTGTAASGRTEDRISQNECRAIRALDADDAYTRSEIAFMFECKTPTVSAHADRECHHQRLPQGGEIPDPGQEYTDGQLLTAYRIVYDRQEYQRMSRYVYNDNRPDEFPDANTIRQRFGGWPEARKRAFGDRKP